LVIFGLLTLQVIVHRQLAHVSRDVNMQWGFKENSVAVIAFTTAENQILNFSNS
jgi:hypothetical protein